MTRVAALDCGTNSLRLLVTDIDPRSGTQSEVVRRTEVVRLGYGVDRTGLLDPQALARTLRVTRDYAAECDRLGVEAVRFVATSASRDARNAQDFVDGVRAAFGDRDVRPDVITGQEEAALSFTGATGGLEASGVPAPYLVVDLGGGSTELVLGEAADAGSPPAAISLDIGSVRLTERYAVSDPPTDAQVAEMETLVRESLDRARQRLDLSAAASIIGLAGTVTTITAHALRLPAYDREQVHLSRIPVDVVLEACTDLLTMTRAERAALPYLQPGRVDVIGAGALIWSAVVRAAREAAGLDVVITSEHDILDGIARSLVPVSPG